MEMREIGQLNEIMLILIACDIFITDLLTLYGHEQISHKSVQRCLQVLSVNNFMTVVSSSFLESQ